MINQNPDFARFYAANKDKSMEALLRDNGVDLGAIIKLLK